VIASSVVKRLAFLTLITAAVACQRVPSLSSYDRSCMSAAECTAVYIGPLGCCDDPCPNAAVRTTNAAKAKNEVEAARECDLRVKPPCVPPHPEGCPAVALECNHGTCELPTPPQDAATDE
jgi:hypothetical protein